MSFLYLGALLFSITGIALIDLRWRVALWWDARRTLLATAASTVVLLIWDLVGIELGLFRMGSAEIMTGIEIVPHLTIEEPVFLIGLSYLSVVAYRLALRIPIGRNPRESDAAEDAS